MTNEWISRRRFLAGMAVGGAGLAGGGVRVLGAEQPPVPVLDADRLHQDGGLVILPGKGTLYMASDFHTRYADFQRWLAATRLVEKLKGGEDVYGLILGDAVDAKPGDTQAEKDGDSRIVDRIRELQESLGTAGRRLIFILGNHEAEVVRIYGLLKQHIDLKAVNRQRLMRVLYSSEDGAYYQQFNFLERITEEQYAYLKDLPVAVLSRHGVVGTHAGPSKTAKSCRDVAEKRPRVVEELLWNRPAEIQANGYTGEDLGGFLKVMERASLLVVGHTPLSLLPEKWVQQGVGVYGEHQIILATSYGSEPGEKSHLVLDLAKRYNGARDLKVGGEIRRLA